MGRPKLSDLSCSICNVSFKKKSTYEEHMESHLASRKQNRQPRTRSNWCHVCRKSFDDDNEYSFHMDKEHEFDSPKQKIKSSKDLFSCESGYVILSKKLLNRERLSKEVKPLEEELSVYENKSSFFTDIKIEPTEKNDDGNLVEYKTSPQKNILTVKNPKIKCPICGMKCKGERGLKIHMSAHKRNSHKNSIDASQSEDEINDEDNQFDKFPVQDNLTSPPSHCINPSLLLSKSNVVNLGQNTQPSYILSVPQLHNQSLSNIVSLGNSANNGFNAGNQVVNLLSISDQSNATCSQVVPKQIPPSFDDVPKFDCGSEKYLKWLKKFISNCKMQKYPLSPETYEKISFISGEIVEALCDPSGPLKQVSVHYFVSNMYNMLAEIMMTHMENICNSAMK